MTRTTALLPPKPQPSVYTAPKGACDTHVHMLAGPDELWLNPDRTEDPAQTFAKYISDFRLHLQVLGIDRAVIVQSIFYSTDNTVTVNAVRELGPGFKGIGLLPDEATDAQLDAFVDWNFCGVRLNYVHGGVLTWEGAKAMAPRLAERGLHIQMLCHADRHMDRIAPDLAQLPCTIVFDHIGWPDLSGGPDHPGFQALCCALVEERAYVKLSGLYRLCGGDYSAADAHVAALVAANPDRCLWGSDWPHIMLNGADMPLARDLWDAFHRVVTDDAIRRKILVHNPQALYRF